MGDQDAHGLIKLAILMAMLSQIGHINVVSQLVCYAYQLPTYIFLIDLPKYVLPTYLPTIYLFTSYLPTIYQHNLLVFYINRYVHLKTQVGTHVYLPIYLVRYLLIHTYEKIEIEMLLYTLTKKFIEVQRKILNAFGIIQFYKVMQFDGQDIVPMWN